MDTLYRLWYNSPRLRGTMSESSCSEDEPLWLLGRCLQLEQPVENETQAEGEDESVTLTGESAAPTPEVPALQRTVAAHVSQLFWSTYRTGFPPITPGAEDDGGDGDSGSTTNPCGGKNRTIDNDDDDDDDNNNNNSNNSNDNPALRAEGPTSDAGWGCTIRCGQMVVGAALARIKGGWGAKLPAELARLFADTPCQPLSIHAITRLGLKKWNKGIGEWFGPSTISVVISEIVNANRPCGLSVCLFPDMMIVREEVEERVHQSGGGGGGGDSGGEDWETPLLILVTVRVGVSNINPIYLPSLAAYFRAPQFLGILGGKNSRHATYFYAMQGSNVFYLDPHTVQPAVGPDGKAEGMVDGGHVSTDGVHVMPIEEADPSMSIAFLCENRESFESLCTLVEGVAEKGGALLKVVNKAPVMEDFDDTWADDGE